MFAIFEDFQIYFWSFCILLAFIVYIFINAINNYISNIIFLGIKNINLIFLFQIYLDIY